PDMVRLCNRYRIACMPGIMTIRDAVEGLELGVDILKLFPGEAFGPKMIKAIAGPIPQASIMPTGGVDVNNVGEWIKAGAVAVGAGGALTGGAKKGDYASITKIGREFVNNIKAARGK
ncbi:MAG TPA: bifunctional 2-keto-4-hydroxyglutarate aldolase/2-keto-3-deoxy-6-phosphogluconate aldolase, partial [Firmicutes bacterium]|nr:bifunctional 2-keto-4-hydroxyglutarate aldolase/2-keto-3-deoxy-6-phosphogluconate aldolase [Bacillota bacterium]